MTDAASTLNVPAHVFLGLAARTLRALRLLPRERRSSSSDGYATRRIRSFEPINYTVTTADQMFAREILLGLTRSPLSVRMPRLVPPIQSEQQLPFKDKLLCTGRPLSTMGDMAHSVPAFAPTQLDDESIQLRFLRRHEVVKCGVRLMHIRRTGLYELGYESGARQPSWKLYANETNAVDALALLSGRMTNAQRREMCAAVAAGVTDQESGMGGLSAE